MNNAPIIYNDISEIVVAPDAQPIEVSVCKLREKLRLVSVRTGMVVAQALDAAGIEVDVTNPNELDLRVNGHQASLLQVLNANETVYIASKIAGA